MKPDFEKITQIGGTQTILPNEAVVVTVPADGFHKMILYYFRGVYWVHKDFQKAS